MSSYLSFYEEIDHHLAKVHQEQNLSSRESREALLKRSVLSASGLRFCCSGDDNDLNTWPEPDVQSFVLCAAACLAERLEGDTVWIGCDTRPTGRFLMTLLYRFFKAKGYIVKVLGQGPIPQIMAATHQEGAAGFCYLTASHNPPGHNGLKMGFSDGAVMPAAKARDLIAEFKERMLDDTYLNGLWDTIHWCTGHIAQEVDSRIQEDASKARDIYRNFALKTAHGSDGELLHKELKESLQTQAYHFVFDMNGSSRLLGPDIELLESMGVHCEVFGNEPGVFSHAIIPEGESLKIAAGRVQELIDQGQQVIGALVPDCDGDRGNLVLPIHGKARLLSSQETFTLCVLAEVLTRRLAGDKEKMAIAVNGPTSLRLKTILKDWNVEVYRAEVGEANVLAKAKELRDQGWHVPICGEGSNGGNITYPSTVRDPLLTLLSLLKFLYHLPGSSELSTAGQYIHAHSTSNGSILEQVLSTFPAWATTDVSDEKALMPVPPIEHEKLKQAYEQKLQNHFDNQPEYWTSKGIAQLKWVSYEGTLNIDGPGGRPAPGKGGLAAMLLDKNGKEKGFMWMRGSGTEPVFRVLVDFEQDQSIHDELLVLHRELIESCTQA